MISSTGKNILTVVDGLEYLFVEHHCLLRLKCILQNAKGVCQTLDADSDWSMSLVGEFCLRDGIEVDIDHPVQVSRHHLRLGVEQFKVKLAVLYESGKGERSQVANRHLVF